MLKAGIKKYIAVFPLIIFIFTINFIGASQPKVLDSLKTLAINTDEEGKPSIYLTLSEKYGAFNCDSAIFFGNKALDHALSLNNNKMVIKCLLKLASINGSIGNNEKSLLLYNQAKHLCLKGNDEAMLAEVYMGLAGFHNTRSNYAKVFGSLDSALIIIEKNDIAYLKPIIYRQIGNLYLSLNDLSHASFYAKQAINFSRDDPNKTNYINSLLLKGSILFGKHDHDSSLFYYEKALSVAKNANNKPTAQKTFRKLADFHIHKKDYHTANLYLDSSMVYCRELNFTLQLSALISYKAHICSLKGDYKNTLRHNLQALKLREPSGRKLTICASYLNIGGNYTQLGEYEKAYSYLEKGMKMAKDQNIITYLAYGYDKLFMLNKLQGNYEKAMQYAELKAQYNDSILLNKTNERVMFFRNQYELEKEKTITASLKLKKKTNDIFYLSITILLGAGIILLLFRINYSRRKDIAKRKKNESDLKTIQKNLEKTVKTQDKMFSVIAHDLVGPFSSILGFSELMAKEFNSFQTEDHMKFSKLIYESSKNTFDLLTNLLQWSRSQLGSIELHKENINLHELVSENIEPLKLMLNKKGISFHNEVRRDFIAHIDSNTISIIIRNLLSNAIKFTPQGGIIRVTATNIDNKIKIEVSDTGIGIKSEDISGLFNLDNNKSQKGTEDEKGTGLGLVLCKEFSELNNGTITVESEHGKGSKFTLSLPSV